MNKGYRPTRTEIAMAVLFLLLIVVAATQRPISFDYCNVFHDQIACLIRGTIDPIKGQ